MKRIGLGKIKNISRRCFVKNTDDLQSKKQNRPGSFYAVDLFIQRQLCVRVH
jgi:hypothetical protein